MATTYCKRTLLLFLIVISHQLILSQTYSPRWQYSWGGNRQDDLFTMIPIAGNRYFYAGVSASDPSCTKSDICYGYEDMAAMVFDDAGNKLWEKTYGGNLQDGGYSAVKVPSGGYIIAGTTNSGPSGNKTSPSFGYSDVWVVRIDDNGNLLWERTYGSVDFENGLKIVATSDGGFLIGGSYMPAFGNPPIGFGSGDYHLIKIDGNGNLLWSKYYGGSAAEEFYDLIPSSDGNFFLSGTSLSGISGNKTSPPLGDFDIWLIKVAPDGTKLWDKSLGTAGGDYRGRLVALHDGNILTVESSTSIGRIRKLDLNGNQLWVRSCIGDIYMGFFELAAEDPQTGNIYVGATSKSDNAGCKTTPWYGGGWFGDIWLVVYDSVGNKIDDYDFGGNDVDEPLDIDIVNDEIWITGWSDSPLSGNKTTDNCGQTADGWIIRLSKRFYINSQTPASLCNSQNTMKVHYTTTANYNAGNVFTVQLSDASGSFSSFINIGSISAIKTDSIIVNFPAGLPVSPNYKIRVVANSPADTTAPYSFWLHGSPLVNLGNDTTICQNTNISLNAGVQVPGSQFLWSNGNSTSSIVVANPGIYWCEVQTASCGIDRDSIIINVKQLPLTSIGPDTSFCAGQLVNLQSNSQLSDVSYLWNTGATGSSITVQNGGVYWLKVTNACGSSTDSLLATNYPLPVVALNKSNFLCEGSSRVLDAGTGYSNYSWNTGDATPTITVDDIGVYAVLVTDNNGCTDRDTAIINQLIKLPSKFLSPDTAICSYEEILLKATSNFSGYLWNTGATSNSITVKLAATYWLQVKDSYGCIGKDTIVVKPKDCPNGFYMPTGFTPNADGKNDLCRPTIFGNLAQYHFTLYNKWGEKIYETNDRTRGWDGKLKGVALETGVFVWTCSYQIAGDNPRFEKGTVVLIR